MRHMRRCEHPSYWPAMQHIAQPVQEPRDLPLDGESALVTPIGDDLALIVGVADAVTDQFEALLNGDPSMSMKAEIVHWSRRDAPADAATGFVAIVPIRL